MTRITGNLRILDVIILDYLRAGFLCKLEFNLGICYVIIFAGKDLVVDTEVLFGHQDSE